MCAYVHVEKHNYCQFIKNDCSPVLCVWYMLGKSIEPICP